MSSNRSIGGNLKIYTINAYLGATVLLGSIQMFYYIDSGMTFAQVALIQSIGSIIAVILEVPFGVLGDKFGLKKILVLGAICATMYVALLLFFPTFLGFLIAEIFSAFGSALNSGAGTALLYNSLEEMEQESDYLQFVTKITNKTTVIFAISKLISPVLYSINKLLPIVYSLAIYVMITVIKTRLIDVRALDEKTGEQYPGEQDHMTWFQKFWLAIEKYKMFLTLSIFSTILFCVISNYGQFMGPFIRERGFDITYYGVLLFAYSMFGFLGSKLVQYTHAFLMKHSIPMIIITALLVCLSVLVAGGWTTIASGVIGYFGVSFFLTIFDLIMGNELNKSIPSKQRATLLSVSSLFDELSTALVDPFIGYMIDRAGFSHVYFYMGLISFLLVLVIYGMLLLLKNRNIAKGKNGVDGTSEDTSEEMPEER